MSVNHTGNIQPSIDKEEHAHVGGEDGPGAKKVIILGANGEQIVDFGAKYGTNNIDKASSTLTYVGKEDADGNWVIQKIDTSSGVSITYATQLCNPETTSYSVAWANRTSLVYESYKNAF